MAIQPRRIRKVEAKKANKPETTTAAMTMVDPGTDHTVLSGSLPLDILNVFPEEQREWVDEIPIQGQWGAKVGVILFSCCVTPPPKS